MLLFWRTTRIVIMGAVIVCTLVFVNLVVLVGLTIMEGQGELFVRASIGAIVTVTIVWLLGQAARHATHRTTDLDIARWAAAIRLDPHDITGELQRGVAHAQNREYARAIAHFDAALELDPSEPNAHVGRVHAYAALGQLDRLIAEYTKMIELDPTDALAYGVRATAYNMVGRWDLAIPDATEAIRLAPQLYLGYDARGYGYWQRGNFTWILKLFAKRWMPARSALLRAFLRHKHFRWHAKIGTPADLQQAVADFTEALRLNPTAVDCYTGRALAYRSLGEHAKAVADEAASRAAAVHCVSPPR